jgi:alkyl hydroperoxide reductase subunit F
MLDAEIKAQLEQYIQLLEGPVVLKISAGDDLDMKAFVNDIANMSDLINVVPAVLPRTPSRR